MTLRHAFLHNRVVQALLNLSNPNKSVCLPLVKGKAAGKIDLIHQLFPPKGVHRNTIPVTYTFTVRGIITHELALMVSMVDTGDGADGMIFGYIAHDHWEEIYNETRKQVDGYCRYVVVQYNPVTREGYVYMYNEVFEVIQLLYKKRYGELYCS